ncbi:MAG: hypothetical protein ACOYBY_10670 [Dermatophilaceae bacterium]
MQFAAAAVDGLVLSSITVHALVRLQVGAGTVGIVLAAAAAVALATAPFSGAVADRIGLPLAGAWMPPCRRSPWAPTSRPGH